MYFQYVCFRDYLEAEIDIIDNLDILEASYEVKNRLETSLVYLKKA
ncbi:hypothetical protein [Borrelia persica]|nr:hypothetical protein [Borrelia persica]